MVLLTHIMKESPVLNRNGQMIFYSIYFLTHWTDRYMGDDERITIAFDIYSKEWFDYDVFEDAKQHWIKI